MAEKGFGVKEVNLIGASGTPTITSPNNLNLNAVNVAISTNASIGGNLTVTGTVGIAGTLTYEDVTNIDSVGVVTAREGIIIPDNKVLSLGNRLVGSTAGDLRLYHDTNNSYIDEIGSGNLYIRNGSNNSIFCQTSGTVQLYYNGNDKLATTNTGVTVSGTLVATTFSGSGASLTNLPAANLTGTLPAISGANLTGIAVTEAPVVDYTVTANGSSAYRFHGGGVDETADNPDLYLIRGQKYRFNNTTGSGHPFAIRVASNGSAYSNGVTGSQNGIQFFTVPYDAPAKIFYQCTIHSGMVGNIYIRGANGQNDNVGVTTFSGEVVIAESIAVNRPRIVLSAPNDGTNYRHLFGANLQVNSSGTFTTPTANISGGGWEYLPANSLNAHGHLRYLSAPDTNATSSTPLERLRIDATGRLLIGVDVSTNNDSYVQSFKSTGNDSTITVGNVATSASGLCRYDFAPSNKVVGSRIECHASEDFSTSANRTADLVFITRHNGTLSEKVRIGSSGQIGLSGANYGSSGQVLTSQGSSSAPVWANAGIIMADQWRITSSFTLPASVSTINSNWARVASPSGYGKIGSAMSESSGLFTFPSTGVYLIEFTILLAATSSQRYLGHRVQTTTDNFSSANTVAESLGHMGITNSFGAYHTSSSSYIFDVTNTSTHKIRFAGVAFTPSATDVIGNTNQNSTFATFIRLGDT